MVGPIGFRPPWGNDKKDGKEDKDGVNRNQELDHEIEENREDSKAPRPCLVEVFFPARGRSWTYYNDQFNLKKGARVYVSGKLADTIGRVVSVQYNFRINLADYQRVVAHLNPDIHGDFYLTGSHVMCFDPQALTYDQALLWFMGPNLEPVTLVSGSDDQEIFALGSLDQAPIDFQVFKRGHDYFLENRVVYLSLQKGEGSALVEGSKAYEVFFHYDDESRVVSKLTCSCYCTGVCKHACAVLMQLEESRDAIDEHFYHDLWEKSDYMAAISKTAFVENLLLEKKSGRMIL